MEHQYLSDMVRKRFFKESWPIKESPRAFIRYEYNESKQPNPVPFIEGIYLYFTIFSDSNQLISKVNEGPKFFVRNFKIIAITKVCITFYHALSLLITPNHNLLFIMLKRKPFSLATLKLGPRFQFFITSYHALTLLTTPYSLDWKENHFMLATLKLVPRLQFFMTSITPCHSLSHLKPKIGKKTTLCRRM